MTTLIIIQARMGASRLPGKPLLKVLGRPLLSYLLERLKQVSNADKVVLATTLDPKDDCIAHVAQEAGAYVFRGSENDVLDRYYQAAREFKADIVVRITADCPLMDPALVTKLIDLYKKQKSETVFVSNTIQRTYPRGMDIEVFSFKALKDAWQNASQAYEREHVTPYLYTHPEKFHIVQDTQKENLSQYRWTVDTKEDFAVVSKLLSATYPANPLFSLNDLITIFLAHPDWQKLNAHIPQKTLTLETAKK